MREKPQQKRQTLPAARVQPSNPPTFPFTLFDASYRSPSGKTGKEIKRKTLNAERHRLARRKFLFVTFTFAEIGTWCKQPATESRCERKMKCYTEESEKRDTMGRNGNPERKDL